jgi:hypothetical protein
MRRVSGEKLASRKQFHLLSENFQAHLASKKGGQGFKKILEIAWQGRRPRQEDFLCVVKGWVPVSKSRWETSWTGCYPSIRFSLRSPWAKRSEPDGRQGNCCNRYQRRLNPPLALNTLLRADDESQESGQRLEPPPGYKGLRNRYVREI